MKKSVVICLGVLTLLLAILSMVFSYAPPVEKTYSLSFMEQVVALKKPVTVVGIGRVVSLVEYDNGNKIALATSDARVWIFAKDNDFWKFNRMENMGFFMEIDGLYYKDKPSDEKGEKSMAE